VLTVVTRFAAIAIHNAPGLEVQTMIERQPRRIPTWLTVDLTIIAASIIIIAAAMWVGLMGFALP
jgi:hypothetical protein